MNELDLKDPEIAKSAIYVMRCRALDYTHPASEAWWIVRQLSDAPDRAKTHAELAERSKMRWKARKNKQRAVYACRILLSKGLVESRVREGAKRIREYWLTANPRLLDRDTIEELEAFVDDLFQVP